MPYSLQITIPTLFDVVEVPDHIEYIAVDFDGTITGFEVEPIAINELQGWEYKDEDIDTFEPVNIGKLPWEYENWKELLFWPQFEEEEETES